MREGEREDLQGKERKKRKEKGKKKKENGEEGEEGGRGGGGAPEAEPGGSPATGARRQQGWRRPAANREIGRE